MNLMIILGALLILAGAVMMIFVQIVLRKRLRDFLGGNIDDVS